MTDEEVFAAISRFCKRFNLPFDHLPEILNDQKVIPMMRGKGLEYQVFDFLEDTLPKETWRVDKYNVNPQPGQTDADTVVTHLETGIEIIIECKHAVRGSFSAGSPRGQSEETKKPHFKVKCHKSRSNNQRTITNDRYFVDDFDLIFTTPENAFIENGEQYEIKRTPFLRSHFGITDPDSATAVLSKDLRVALTTNLAENDNTIPRTPVVLLNNDPHWRPAIEIEQVLMMVVRRKQAQRQRKPSAPAFHKKKANR